MNDTPQEVLITTVHVRWTRKHITTVCNKHEYCVAGTYILTKEDVETLQLKIGYVWCTKCEDTAFNPLERLALADLGDNEVPAECLIPNVWLGDKVPV